MVNHHDTTNRLLANLSPSDCAAATERGIIVELERGRDLAAAGDPIDHCWFPLSGLVSVIVADPDGKEAEVGVIGREGMANAGVVTGAQRSPMRLLVQIAGAALRVSERIIVAAAADRPAVAKLLIAYNQVLGVQAAFSALAYAQYTLPQRLARWALMCGDRVGDANIDLTHEALSMMLGVRRAGVTVTIQALEKRGAIMARRGGFSIIDRPALLAIAGAGYGPSEAEYRRSVASPA